jgi:hypothetical protein
VYTYGCEEPFFALSLSLFIKLAITLSALPDSTADAKDAIGASTNLIG